VTRAYALLALLGVALLVIGGRLALQPPRASAADEGPAPSAVPAPAQAPTPAPARPADPTEPTEPAPAPRPPGPVSFPPAELALPTLGTVAPVVPVGVLESGQLQLPEQPATVGWWAAGTLPGAGAGTVVVAGHLDAAAYGPGALQALLHVEVGDRVELRDGDGATLAYRVTARHSYDKAELPGELFTTEGPPQLALITCGGEFDQRRARYADNVVVLAVPA
jgi:hypothetical protein